MPNRQQLTDTLNKIGDELDAYHHGALCHAHGHRAYAMGRYIERRYAAAGKALAEHDLETAAADA